MNQALPSQSSCVLLQSPKGSLLVNRHDTAQALAMLTPGISPAAVEIGTLLQIVATAGDGAVVLDVGAHVGMVTLALAREVAASGGQVISFEPQRPLYYMLAGNIALAGLSNVRAYHIAVSDREEVLRPPVVDYDRHVDLGEVRFAGLAPARGLLATHDRVRTARLDRLRLERVDLLKIDAAGMEMQVLRGAQGILQTLRPWVWLDCKGAEPASVVRFMMDMGYRGFTATDRHLLFVCPERMSRAGVPIHLQEWAKDAIAA